MRLLVLLLLGLCCLPAGSGAAPDSTSFPIPPLRLLPASNPLNPYQLAAHFQEHLRYPELAREYGAEGTVIVEFLVLEDGTPDRAKVIEGRGLGLDEEAIRLVYTLPKWRPMTFGGRAFVARVRMPIAFSLY